MDNKNTIETNLQKVIQKISQIRNEKGFSIEYVANQLQISPAAYHKIERFKTKLTLERLYQLVEILEVSLPEIFEFKDANYFHQIIRENGVGNQTIENLYQYNKELVEQLVKAKDEEISFLRDLLNKK